MVNTTTHWPSKQLLSLWQSTTLRGHWTPVKRGSMCKTGSNVKPRPNVFNNVLLCSIQLSKNRIHDLLSLVKSNPTHLQLDIKCGHFTKGKLWRAAVSSKLLWYRCLSAARKRCRATARQDSTPWPATKSWGSLALGHTCILCKCYMIYLFFCTSYMIYVFFIYLSMFMYIHFTFYMSITMYMSLSHSSVCVCVSCDLYQYLIPLIPNTSIILHPRPVPNYGSQ